jgi:hypothetical protein
MSGVWLSKLPDGSFSLMGGKECGPFSCGQVYDMDNIGSLAGRATFAGRIVPAGSAFPLSSVKSGAIEFMSEMALEKGSFPLY